MKQIFMKSFSHYINEVVITDKPHVVPEYLKGTKHKYHSGEDFAKGSTHIGNIGGLEIHSKENPGGDRKSTRLNSSHVSESRMPSSA